MEPEDRIVDLPPGSLDLRAFLGMRHGSDEIETQNVWRFAVVLLGDPVTDVALHVLFHGEPDSNDQMTLSFRLSDAHMLHQALGELLEKVSSSEPG